MRTAIFLIEGRSWLLAKISNQPRPPPGELTEAALEHFITPRVRDEVWELVKK
jgi:hypothetical protein